eukprot:618814-Rhodomonas_salina.1
MEPCSGFHTHLLRVESAGVAAPNFADFRILFTSKEAARRFAVEHEAISAPLFTSHGSLFLSIIPDFDFYLSL